MCISEAGTIFRWFSEAYLMRSSGHILLIACKIYVNIEVIARSRFDQLTVSFPLDIGGLRFILSPILLQ
jgi:hypothetical protein